MNVRRDAGWRRERRPRRPRRRPPRNTSAAAASVAPVVTTSSTSSTRLGAGRASPNTPSRLRAALGDPQPLLHGVRAGRLENSGQQDAGPPCEQRHRFETPAPTCGAGRRHGHDGAPGWSASAAVTAAANGALRTVADARAALLLQRQDARPRHAVVTQGRPHRSDAREVLHGEVRGERVTAGATEAAPLDPAARTRHREEVRERVEPATSLGGCRHPVSIDPVVKPTPSRDDAGKTLLLGAEEGGDQPGVDPAARAARAQNGACRREHP